MVENNLLIVFFVILLVIGIPSILFSLLTSLYFMMMNKIRVTFIRPILPPVTFIMLVVVLSVFAPGLEIYINVGFITVIYWLLFGAIISMGVITPFPLFEKRLSKTKPWLHVFIASIITFFYLLLAEVANQAGLMRIVSRVHTDSSIVFLSVFFIEAVIIASLVYAGFTLYSLFIKKPNLEK